MRRLSIVSAIFALIALSGFSAAPLSAQARPNILFIYSDDQSYKTIGCYPEAPEWVRTPNIDRLAENGVRFERCYLGAWCMTSRATLLTGRLPHAIESMRMEGEYPGSTYDPELCPFWPSVFRRHGYHTAQIGKWHTGVDTGWGRDWDYQVVWNRPRFTDNAGAYYTGQILTINGVPQERPDPGYSTDNYTQLAVDYIQGKNREQDKPWYLWLCYGAVHGPTTPAARHKGSYAGNSAPLPKDVFGPRPGKPQYLDVTQAWVAGDDGQPMLKGKPRRAGNFDQNEAGLTLQAWIQQMNECGRAIDEGVGRLIEALRETGQLENTVVVYTADQGYAMGEHGLNMKLAPYDAAMASPLIVSYSGELPTGKVCAHPINSADLVVSFFELAGIELPWKMDGRDVTPLFRNPETTDWSHPTLMTFTGATYGSDTHALSAEKGEIYHNVPWWALVRDGRYKYIRNLVPDETEEVYDLQADPEELHNLAGDPANRALLERLRKLAIRELERTDAGFVNSLPRTRAEAETAAAGR
jgi:arylsulfatase A-like enzyme